MQQTDANHCTAACTSTICNCPRLVQSKISIVCELHCPSTACEHMRRARTSAPYGVQAWHECTHLQRPGCLPAAPTTCSASKKTAAAPCQQVLSVGVVALATVADSSGSSCRTAEAFAVVLWRVQQVVTTGSALASSLAAPLEPAASGQHFGRG